MKLINKASLFDKANAYYKDVESSETVVSLQSKIIKMNEELIKKGAKYTFVPSTFDYVYPARKNND